MKRVSYKGHDIQVLPFGAGYKVRVSGPRVVAQAGAFIDSEQAIAYGKARVDGKHEE